MMQDVLPQPSDLDGKYKKLSSNLATHPKLDAIPGRGQMVLVNYAFDIDSVDIPEVKMLAFGATCIEFEDQAGAVLGLQVQIEITQDAPSMKLGPLMDLPYADESYAAEGTFPQNGRAENIAHVWMRADNFVCQYSGQALKDHHEPLKDIQAVVEKIITR
jgi:hypothetical protein